MLQITESADLAALCQRLSAADFVTVDTEFMRERTYWPHLCLVQIAGPDDAAAVDPLAAGMDLAPFFALLANPKVLKVFHAARQDLEIFFNLTGRVPVPLFDTQVAAMVCGFGEAASYESLVAQLTRARIDKSMRFTDWSARPLSERQISYALADVTHLRQVYLELARRLHRSSRASWLAEEMGVLMDTENYRADPDKAWRRLKPRNMKPRALAVLQALAAWREREAQRRDVPRNRILRDETVVDVAVHAPRSVADLARMRSVPSGLAEGRHGRDILDAVGLGLAVPEQELPLTEAPPDLPQGIGPLVEMLKVLLKAKCDEHDVAPKLIASVADLERMAASDQADVPALSGWRFELFGRHAIALKHGQLAAVVRNRRIIFLPLDQAQADASAADVNAS